MKLVISDGEVVLLNLEDHRVDLPDADSDRATSMLLLSEALVLLANACEATAIEDAASEMSDSIRARMTNRMLSAQSSVEVQHQRN